MPPFRLAEWPRAAASPDFNLVDVDGVPHTLRDYRGKVVVVLFGFLHCPDTCPAELFELGLVMKQLGPVAAQVQVLFITLDPRRDVPRLLQDYVTRFDPRFIGLSGPVARIDAAASSFNVQYARVQLGADYTIDHSTGIYVFDARGRLRLLGAAASPVADFVHDLALLASINARQ